MQSLRILATLLGLCAAACGPTSSAAQGSGDGSSSGADGASAGEEATPCQPREEATLGLIRKIGDGFRLEFAEFNYGDSAFGCDAEPPCEGDYGTHTVATLLDADTSLPMMGEYAVETGRMIQTERTCDCCNGEGGEPDESDSTYPVDYARLVVDGADATCVSGEYLNGRPRGAEDFFVARWCP